MKYKNPIILSDYSDPDVIKHNSSYYMISSSFNQVPGIPVLKSKNLINWKEIGYVYNELPFDRFDKVCHGDGAWAPSLRYHDGLFYCLIPFHNEGIYVSCCADIEKGDWSKPWCLYKGDNFEDPCPIWHDGKCYIVMGFVYSHAKSRAELAVFEATADLKTRLTDYKVIFDGSDVAPILEGPKFYKKGKYFYIMAPAGFVKTGWQCALRSKNIYGPYELKVVLVQGDSNINGPHQGALVGINKKESVFIHFQDMNEYGRVVNLQPVKWINDWPICGNVKYEYLCGSAVEEHEYFINEKSNYKLLDSDNFENGLSLLWQTPANRKDNYFKIDNGLILNCCNEEIDSLNQLPNLLLSKIKYRNFKVKAKMSLYLENNDETGIAYMGKEYAYLCVKKIDDKYHLLLKQGKFKEKDILLEDVIYDKDNITFNLEFNDGYYKLGYNNKYFDYKFKAYPGMWIGGKYGIYAKGSKGYSKCHSFKCIK